MVDNREIIFVKQTIFLMETDFPVVSILKEAGVLVTQVAIRTSDICRKSVNIVRER